MLCNECGKETPDDSNFCVNCRAKVSNGKSLEPNKKRSKSKLVAGLLAIFLGVFGFHKFYLGYKIQGLIMLIISVGSVFLTLVPIVIINIIAFIEGIRYLVKSDDDFEEIYVDNKKPWF